MTLPVSEENIKGVECKHVVYTLPNDDGDGDALIVKEVIHTKDGQLIPNLRIIENYKRDFFYAREGQRNYKEKKTQEKINNLQRYTCTQRNLLRQIARAKGVGTLRGGLRQIAKDPYLYGCDITTPTLLKKEYQDRSPDCLSPNGVAVFDIETDVVHGTEKPILMALTFKDRVYMCATKFFVGDDVRYLDKLNKAVKKYLEKYTEERKITYTLEIVDTPGEGVKRCFQKAHEWKPEFVTVWNIDFDIPRCVKVLEEEGIDPAQVFSDPSVPERFKFFRYKQGNATKKTASGRIDSIHPAERWHVAECPATFFLIDSMCVYKRIRMAKQNLPSYSLDNVMKEELSGLGKLKFEEADEYSGLAWHVFMQTYYKIEYSVYNIFDCIGVELLDEKTKDLQLVISTQSRSSEYTIYNSQPRRLVDDFYFFCRERGFILGSCSNEMVHELDAYVVGMNNWIITLPSHQTVDNGVRAIKELPDVRTYIRRHVADLDIVSTYPNVQVILNISRETTLYEMFKIKGCNEYQVRMAGINLTGGHVNAVEIAVDVMKAPSFDKMLTEFLIDHPEAA